MLPERKLIYSMIPLVNVKGSPLGHEVLRGPLRVYNILFTYSVIFYFLHRGEMTNTRWLLTLIMGAKRAIKTKIRMN